MSQQKIVQPQTGYFSMFSFSYIPLLMTVFLSIARTAEEIVWSQYGCKQGVIFHVGCQSITA